MSPMPNFSDDDSSPITPNKMFPDVSIPSATNSTSKENDSNTTTLNVTTINGAVTSVTLTSAPDIELSSDENEPEVDMEEEPEKADVEKIEVDSTTDLGNRDEHEKCTLTRDTSTEILAESSIQNAMTMLANVSVQNCALPLPIFTHGYLCHPYLSLPYLDLLNDMNVRGYIVGATNVLFKQKKQLADVLVEIEGSRIESQVSFFVCFCLHFHI